MQHTRQIAATRANFTELTLVRIGAIVVFVADYLYALSFNVLPDGPRLAFAGGVLVINTALAIIAYTSRQNITNNLILLSLVITCVCWGLSYALGYSGEGKGYSFQAAAKQIGVYMIAIWVLAYPELLPRRLLALLAIVTLVGGGAYAVLAPRVNLAGEEFFVHITGVPEAYSALVAAGHTNLLVGARHVSATLILLNVLLIDQLRRLRVLSPLGAWLLILFGTFVIFGYWSRNNLVSLAIYFMLCYYYASKDKGFVFVSYLLIVGISFSFLLAVIDYLGAEVVYYWGSGRIGTYAHRFDLLANRDIGALLWGSGLESDWFRSYTWLHNEKNSHNMYLNVLIERGIIGLLGLFIFLAAIYIALPSGIAKAFFWMIALSGLISHGFVSDTQFLLMLFAAMGLAIVAAKEERRDPGWMALRS